MIERTRGQLDSVKMLEVVVNRGNNNPGNHKWLSLSALVVVTLLVVVSNQHGVSPGSQPVSRNYSADCVLR